MRRVFWITLIAAALTSLGCVVPSLHPLFTERDLVFEPRIIGAWTDEDSDFWVFEKACQGGYRLAISDTLEMSLFDAHLLELGSHRFLDLYPRTEDSDDSFQAFHLLPVHTFYKVILDGESLLLVPMDLGWLEKEIESGALQVAHAWPEDELLLTAPTEDLQELVLLFADDPAAFPVDSTTSVAIELERTVL